MKFTISFAVLLSFLLTSVAGQAAVGVNALLAASEAAIAAGRSASQAFTVALNAVEETAELAAANPGDAAAAAAAAAAVTASDLASRAAARASRADVDAQAALQAGLEAATDAALAANPSIAELQEGVDAAIINSEFQAEELAQAISASAFQDGRLAEDPTDPIRQASAAQAAANVITETENAEQTTAEEFAAKLALSEAQAAGAVVRRHARDMRRQAAVGVNALKAEADAALVAFNLASDAFTVALDAQAEADDLVAANPGDAATEAAAAAALIVANNANRASVQAGRTEIAALDALLEGLDVATEAALAANPSVAELQEGVDAAVINVERQDKELADAVLASANQDERLAEDPTDPIRQNSAAQAAANVVTETEKSEQTIAEELAARLALSEAQAAAAPVVRRHPRDMMRRIAQLD